MMAAKRRPLFHFDYILVFFATFWMGRTLSTSDYRMMESKSTKCSPPSRGYSIQNITTGQWSLAVKADKCIGYQKGFKINCTYTMQFCGISCDEASICVTTFNRTGKNKTEVFAVGNKVDNPFSADDTSMIGSFYANYAKGGNYTNPKNVTCQLSANIKFQCNRNLPWKPSKSGNSTIQAKALTFINFDTKNCQLNATFDYEGACIGLIPASTYRERLSAGTVLIIIFFVSVTAYFALGIIINLLRGYRGKDVLPQSDFWITLPELIFDGCRFTCRCGAEEQSAYDSI